MSPEIIAAIIGGISAIIAALIQRGPRIPRQHTTEDLLTPKQHFPSTIDHADRALARPNILIRIIRGGMIGVAIGAVVFIVLHVSFGRPDDYAEKIFVLIGGGGAIGCIVTLVRLLFFR